MHAAAEYLGHRSVLAIAHGSQADPDGVGGHRGDEKPKQLITVRGTRFTGTERQHPLSKAD